MPTPNSSANIFLGLDGSDTLAGGAGFDWLDYRNSIAGIAVDLQTDLLGFQSGAGGYAAGDVISGFEAVVGSDADDMLTGDAGRNYFFGGAGADTISGGAGNDLITGGIGADVLSGGDGNDRLFYSTSSAAVTINLTVDGSGFQSASGGDASGDVISGFEHVTGSAFGDTLSGNAERNFFSGGDGDDTISAGGGDDFIKGGRGADVLSGGDGLDRLSYAGSASGVSVDLNADGSGFQAASGGDATGDVISGFEHITGSSQGDILTGDDARNFLLGGAGADTISASAGNDFIKGGSGADVLDGGDGFDRLSYAGSSAAVTVDLNSNLSGIQSASGGDAQGDVISNFEHLTGSSHGDVLTGNEGRNFITGGAGADTISGGAGDDFVKSGSGADVIDGGEGLDRLSYAGSNAGVTIDLTADGSGFQSGSGGHAAGDVISNFEHVTGSSHGDDLSGNAEVNNFAGGAGADTISAGGGNDFIKGGSGADVLDGGEGSDRLSYAGSSAAVTVNLTADGSGFQSASGGDAQGDVISGFERVTGTDFADMLTGDDARNYFAGDEGADTLSGGAGNDWISGGEDDDVIAGGVGADALFGGDGVDTLDYSASAGAVMVDLRTGSDGVQSASGADAEGDLITDFEGVIGSSAADILVASHAESHLTGGGGADSFVFATRPSDGALHQITDFALGEDLIEFDQLAFAGIFGGSDAESGGEEGGGGEGGFGEGGFGEGGGEEGGAEEGEEDPIVSQTLFEDQFVANATGEATEVYHRVIYNTTTGVVSYDGDGSDSSAATEIVQLDAGLALTHESFIAGLAPAREPVALDGSFTVEAGRPEFFELQPTNVGESNTVTYTFEDTGYGGNAAMTSSGFFYYDTDGDFAHLREGETATQTLTYTMESLGGTDTGTIDLTIIGREDNPLAFGDFATVDEDASVVITPLDNDRDPDAGSTLRITAVQPSRDGTAVVAPDGQSITFTPDPDFNGDVVLKYYAEDETGRSADSNINVRVLPTNDAPVAHAITGSVRQGEGVYLEPSFTDVDQFDLVRATSVDTTGTTGWVTLLGDGRIEYIARDFENVSLGSTATDQFSYTVTDGDVTSTNTATITINGKDDPLTARDDVFSGAEDTVINLTPLDNDTDVDADDELFIAGVGFPPFGTAQVSEDRKSINYTPPENYNGDVSFSYFVGSSGGTIEEANITLTVTPVNDAPVASDIVVFAKSREELPDGSFTDGLSVTSLGILDDFPEDHENLVIDITAPENESAIFSGSAYYETADFRFDSLKHQFVHNARHPALANEPITEVYTYTVTDAGGLSDTGTITVHSEERAFAPTVGYNIPGHNFVEDEVFTTEALIFDRNDGDTTYLHSIDGGEHLTATISVDRQSYTLVPDAGWNGETTVEVSAYDSTGLIGPSYEIPVVVRPVLEEPDVTLSVTATDRIDQFIVTVTADSNDLGETYLPFVNFSLSATSAQVIHPPGSRDRDDIWELLGGVTVETIEGELVYDYQTNRVWTGFLNEGNSQDFLITIPEYINSDIDIEFTGFVDQGYHNSFYGGDIIRGEGTTSVSIEQNVNSFKQAGTFEDQSIWGDSGNIKHTAGVDIGGSVGLSESFSENLLTVDVGALGVGVTADIGTNLEANGSISANLRAEFSVEGGGMNGEIGFDATLTSVHNETTGQFGFKTSAVRDDVTTFTASSPNAGFEILLDDLGFTASGRLQLGGYAHVHTGFGSYGPEAYPDVRLPEVSFNLASLSPDGISIAKYEGNTLSLADGLFERTFSSFDHTFSSGSPLYNDLAYVKISNPTTTVTDATADSTTAKASSTQDFANFELDLDGIATTIKGIKNPLDLRLELDLGLLRFYAYMEVLDLDLRTDVKYRQTNEVTPDELFGTLHLENGDTFDFKFGDDVTLGDYDDLDQNGNGDIEYYVTTHATATARTQAEMIVDIYDYFAVLDAGGGAQTHGKVAEVLRELGIPSGFDLGTSGPLYDRRGTLLDEEFDINLATRNFTFETDDIVSDWMIA